MVIGQMSSVFNNGIVLEFFTERQSSLFRVFHQTDTTEVYPMARNQFPSPNRPTPREFIEAWQTADCVRQVCKKLKMNVNQARARACRYRKYGIPLKCFPFGDAHDWTELVKYAQQLIDPDAAPVVDDADRGA